MRVFYKNGKRISRNKVREQINKKAAKLGFDREYKIHKEMVDKMTEEQYCETTDGRYSYKDFEKKKNDRVGN